MSCQAVARGWLPLCQVLLEPELFVHTGITAFQDIQPPAQGIDCVATLLVLGKVVRKEDKLSQEAPLVISLAFLQLNNKIVDCQGKES